jgi:signal peptidase II
MIFLLLLSIDQYLKYLSLHHAFSITQYPFFQLTLAKNTGVSLGFLGNTSWLFIISLQIALLLWITTLRPPKYIKAIIFAGAISNIIDRLYYGFVIDYIHFKIGSWQWPAIVNLADIYLCIGILLWLLKKHR